jgi:hypothetical protein
LIYNPFTIIYTPFTIICNPFTIIHNHGHLQAFTTNYKQFTNYYNHNHNHYHCHTIDNQLQCPPR